MAGITDLDQALRSAGIPIRGVQGSGDASCVIDYLSSATAQQRQDGDAIKAGFDWTPQGDTARQVISNRTSAATEFLESTPLGQILRAEALVLIDEINALREWITTFKAATAAATSLANLQTRVAALASMPDRTAAQAKTAIVNKAQDTASDA